MEEKALVSVVITIYKIKKEYVDECVKSVLDQTYDNVEIICLDDCTPLLDYSYLCELSPKIRYIRNETNLGMNKNVKKGFELANGKYIVRLDGDDYFDLKLIEKEVEFLENNPQYGAVCCELQRFGRRKQYIYRPKQWNYESIVNNKCFIGTGYAGGFMFKKDLLKSCSIDESLRMCEDFDFHLQILRNAPIGSINEILYYYRSHDTNLCSSVTQAERLSLIEKIITKHKKYLGEK